MKKLIGFILIWVAIGMIIMFFISNCLMAIALIAIFLILGYNLFTSC